MIVVDRVAHSLDVTRRLGADEVVDANDGDPVAAVHDFARRQGADVVFECVGGFDEGEIAMPLEWQRIQTSKLRLRSSASFAMHDIRPEEAEVLDLIARGVLKTQELITHRFPLERINEAFDTADDKPRTAAIFVALEV
ncbi:MAG: zinc-binding dehydrogenase [Sphingomonas phyllosphaerae]